MMIKRQTGTLPMAKQVFSVALLAWAETLTCSGFGEPVGWARPLKGRLQLEAQILYQFQQLYVKTSKKDRSGSSEHPPRHPPVTSEFPEDRNQTPNQV